ncbi:MAG: right-handed parallel beta-helix repeat-containing protein [Candidatus Marinimicrobia bacterium]|nr:right-handed parallel beta-helix repeat-containing protein [Candidatus Neomarinimicrobiota bacterium]
MTILFRIPKLILVVVLFMNAVYAFETKLTASDAATDDEFGYSVSISDSFAIVGSHNDDADGQNFGSAYIFVTSEDGTNTWSEQVKLIASDASVDDYFGVSVSISDDYAIVGSAYDDDAGTSSGSAYLFYKNDGGAGSWGEQSKLTASDAALGDYFGFSVSISGEYAIVGAVGDDDVADHAGAAYVFFWDGTNWTQQAKLTASDGEAQDWFGHSVSLSGDHAIIGAHQEDDSGDNAGAAYIFQRDGTNWTQQTKLLASDGDIGDNFGASVSISGHYVIVGAGYDGDAGALSGSAYVFFKDEGGTDSWGEQTKLVASNATGSDYFGLSVSIAGNYAIVGAQSGNGGLEMSGSAYLFCRIGNSWFEKSLLTANDADSGDLFGKSVSISSSGALVGATKNDDTGTNSGSAYVFSPTSATVISVPGDYSTIQLAINAAADFPIDVDTIVVQPGTYVENLDFAGKNVVLKSLYGANSTFLEPSNPNYPIVWLYNAETNETQIDGFTLRGASINAGVFKFQGRAQPIVKNCIITQNNLPGNAIYGHYTGVKFENCLFHNNIADNMINFDASDITPYIINCTFTENSGRSVEAGSSTTNPPIIINSIFFGNVGQDLTGTIDANYSLVEGGYFGTGNINVSPMFSDALENDYSLSNFSECIGAGTTSGAPSRDILGNPRSNPEGSIPDIGAYESPLAETQHNSFIHVSITGSDNGTVGVESAPFGTIQAAIDYSMDSDTVLVQTGTYVENINFNGKNIVVGSLFLATQDTAYISQTVIDGGQSGRVVTFHNGETQASKLIGFLIQNGLSSSGAGISCSSSSPTLSHLKILNNSSVNGEHGSGGGGISCYYANPVITNCLISGNSVSPWDGGGIYVRVSSPIIQNVIIKDNIAAREGGGITVSDGTPIISNVSIIGNSADKGAGMYLAAFPGSIIHATIAYNVSASAGGGIISNDGSNATFINSISWNNSPNEVQFDVGGYSTLTFIHSNVDGGDSEVGNASNGTVNWLYGNMDMEPHFNNVTANDFSLNQYSPCIGAGLDTTIIPVIDIEGNLRPNPSGSNPDMGAYENSLGSPVHMPITINIPDDYATIQAGLNAADSTDTVLVQPGTYYENIFWPETNGIKLMSAGDSSNTIIDGSGFSSVIYMNPQTVTIDTTTLIQGFKITNGGNVQSGGGLYISKCSPVIRDCHVLENHSLGLGGGIYISDSSRTQISNTTISMNTSVGSSLGSGGGVYIGLTSEVHLTYCVVTGNHTYGYHDGLGGGICAESSAISIANCEISMNEAESGINALGGGIYINGGSISLNTTNILDNFAQDGGGLAAKSADLSLHEVELLGNSANGNGGGILLNNNNSMFIADSRFSGNSASSGGGFFVSDSEVNGNQVVVSTNQANHSGGGLYLHMSNSISLNDFTIVGNTSNYIGGGVFWGNSVQGSMSNCQVSNNHAILRGGGMYFNYNCIVSIDTTSICNNSSTEEQGGAIYNHTNGNIEFNSVTMTNNFGGEHVGGFYNENGILSIINSNILDNEIAVFNFDNGNIAQCVDNFWGDSSGPHHPVNNQMGLGDSTNAFVNVTPWLSAPNTEAPPIPAQNVSVSGTGNDFVNLEWDSSPLGDFAGFKLYYDTDESGYPYDNTIDVGNVTSYTLSGLNLGTEYFLGVTVYDTDGNESWYSNEVTGVTRVMEVQNLDIAGDEDLNNITNHIPSIAYNYFDSMGEAQTHFHIQVSTHSDFVTLDMWDSGPENSNATSIQYLGNPLLDGASYYLRVRVASGDFWSDWSSLSFRMNSIPSTPILVSPIENLVVDEQIQLVINNSLDAEMDPVQYQYFVFDDNSREVFIDSSQWISDTTWQLSGSLSDNNQYWWYARSYDGYEMSELAIASSFLVNTENNPPGIFNLTYPEPNGETTSLQPVFTWTNSVDPDPIDTVNYTLLLDTPAPGIMTVDVGSSTSWQLPDLLSDNTQYFWKVVASDMLGFETENSGGYLKFTTNQVNENPSIADLIAPDSVMILTLTPAMYWTPALDPDPNDIVHYEIHWWGDGIEFDSLLADTNAVNIPYELEDNSQYFWEVIAMDQTDGISHSEETTFWIDLFDEAPVGFALLNPEDNTTGLSPRPSFLWEMAEDPDPFDYATYIFQVASDSAFTEIAFQTPTAATVGYEIVEDLPNDTEYWWRVIATDRDSLSTVSETFKFTVGYVSIAQDIGLPTEYVLDQNYPNPFNPTTTLRYGIPEDSNVSLVIYDIRGNTISTIESESKQAGWYEHTWNGLNNNGQPVSTGLYLARLQAGSYSKTIKMVYLK